MTTNEPGMRISLSLVIPDEAQPTLAAYRDAEPELDEATLALVDELLESGRATLRPGWAAAAGAGVGEPDRGDNHLS